MPHTSQFLSPGCNSVLGSKEDLNTGSSNQFLRSFVLRYGEVACDLE